MRVLASVWQVVSSPFVISFISSLLAAFCAVILGQERLIRHLVKRERRLELGAVADFWWCREPSRGILIIYGGKLGSFKDDELMESSIATVYSIGRIEELMRKMHGETVSIEKRAASSITKRLEDFHQKHIVVLGGYLSIPALKELQRSLDLAFTQDFEDRNNRMIRRGGDTFCSQLVGDKITTDLGLVTRVYDRRSKRSLLWFSGNYGLGTYGSVLCFTTREFVQDLPRIAHDHGTTQYVVAVERIEDNMIDASHQHLEIRQHKQLDLPQSSVDLLFRSLLASSGAELPQPRL